MSNCNESTFGERMQGPKHEGDCSLAVLILENKLSLEEEMADKEWEDECGIDWDYVKRYIETHRHQYPDYHEHWTAEQLQALHNSRKKPPHEDDLSMACEMLNQNMSVDVFEQLGNGDSFDIAWIRKYIADHRHEYPDYAG